MTSQPDEPAGHDVPEGEPIPCEPAGRDSAGWEVPHLNQAPTAPQQSPPGSFFIEGGAERAAAPPRRKVEFTTLATVAAGLPWVASSFLVVLLVLGITNLLLPIDAVVLPLLVVWLVSGVVVFLPTVEPFLARRLMGLRAPTDAEARTILPAWQNVARHAEIEPSSYTVWIDDREDLTSCLPGAHFLAVPRTLTRVPGRQQAAVLAHEVAHHLGGQGWARLLVHWYSAPARWLARIYRGGFRASSRVTGSPGLGLLGCLASLVWLLLGIAVVVGFITTPELRPILIALPLLPWLSRWAEKRCDRVAADLGYGRDLLDLFQWWQDSGFEEPRPAGVVRQVFSSHPTVANRIHALRTYLTENGLT